MANIATETVASGGLAAAYTAAAATHSFPPGSLIHVKNANASPTNLAMVTKQTPDGNSIANKAITVTNGTEKFVWISTDPIYRDPTTGLVDVTFSVTASVTVACIKPTALA